MAEESAKQLAAARTRLGAEPLNVCFRWCPHNIAIIDVVHTKVGLARRAFRRPLP